MEEISALALDVSMTLCDPAALFLPVVRSVFLARKLALLAFESGAFLGEIQRSDFMSAVS